MLGKRTRVCTYDIRLCTCVCVFPVKKKKKIKSRLAGNDECGPHDSQRAWEWFQFKSDRSVHSRVALLQRESSAAMRIPCSRRIGRAASKGKLRKRCVPWKKILWGGPQLAPLKGTILYPYHVEAPILKHRKLPVPPLINAITRPILAIPPFPLE